MALRTVGADDDEPNPAMMPRSDILEREQTTADHAIETALTLDVEARLTDAGLDPADVGVLRARLLR